MENRNTLIIIIVLLLIAGGAYWAYTQGYIIFPGSEEAAEEEEIINEEEPVNPDDGAGGAASGTELMEAAMVRAHAAAELNVNADDVEVLSATPEEWPDGCLGLGGADEICTQAIVPGFEVVVMAAGAEHTYRTNIGATVIVEDTQP